MRLTSSIDFFLAMQTLAAINRDRCNVENGSRSSGPAFYGSRYEEDTSLR